MKLRKSKSGAALLTVLVAMMIISIMLFEFQYDAMIERKLAFNDLNQLQAYYLAKSGVRIGLLRVALYGRAKRSKEIKNLAQGLDISPYLEMIWNLPLPPFPPEATSLGKLDKQDKDAAEKVLEQTKVKDGKSTHVITTESSKINLNYLVVPAAQRSERVSFNGNPKNLFEHVGQMLINLLEGFIRESENPYEEYGNLKPEEVVLDIMDWVNPGQTRFAGGSKDSFYEQQNPPYKSKRNRFYTVDELRLVKGIDEHLYNKLRPYITVYSYDGKININSASKGVIRSLYRDFTEDDVNKIMEEKNRLGNWTSEKQFVEFISTTLGRSSFKSYFDEKNYPFTVASQSFLIEAAGIISKSKSQIQRTIRVAVALTKGKGASVDPTITNPADCRDAKKYWDIRNNTCTSPPTNQDECINFGGSWLPIDGKNCCKIPNMEAACPDTSGSGAGGQSPDANALKVLYWSES